MSKYSLTKPGSTAAKAEAALRFAEKVVIASEVKEEKGGGNRASYAPAGYRRLTINLPENLHKKLRLKAVERNTTATEIIEQLLSREL